MKDFQFYFSVRLLKTHRVSNSTGHIPDFFLNELLGGHTSFLVGSQVPNQGLNPGQGSKDLES